MSAPVSSPIPLDFGFRIWDLDLGPRFGTWIWDLDLGLGFGTGLGLDNKMTSIVLTQYNTKAYK